MRTENEYTKTEKDQLAIQLQQHIKLMQEGEHDFKKETAKLREKNKKLEHQLESKTEEFRRLQADEQARIQALEQALSTYLKITFSEAKRHPPP